MKVGTDAFKKYQKFDVKRGSDSFETWITKKRTLNAACYIIDNLSGIDFAEFEAVLYFRCDDSRMGYFIKAYNNQLEEAVLNPDSFARGLHGFLLDTCVYIEENNLVRDYFDFFILLEKQHILKSYGIGRKVFDAYISMLMQQTSYFCRTRTDEQVTGVNSDGSLVFKKQKFPYSDAGAYVLEKKLEPGKKHAVVSAEEIRAAYKMYGYNVNSLEQAALLENRIRVYESNVYFMAPFINSRTAILVLKEAAYSGKVPVMPRQWKKTEVYRERLMDRNYMLPRSGVTALYKNAGSIKKIIFFETIRFNEVILLFKVTTDRYGEYSGFYWTKSQLFFSGCNYADVKDGSSLTENFILENYMVLTCDYEIDRKRNFALKQTDMDKFKKEFYYPGQPLVCYSYKKAGGKSGSRRYKYVKEEYMEELRTRSGYVRRLPEGQRASTEAVQAAKELGFNLPEGRTFVRSHDYHVYVKAVKEGDMPE